MRVLAILCHPDDMELTCAGTLIRCVKRGDEVLPAMKVRSSGWPTTTGSTSSPTNASMPPSAACNAA